MADRLKAIPARILEWWNKFTSKQKTIIIAITAAVIFTFVILVYAISRPKYVEIGTYESAAETAKVVQILEDEGITHVESDDALSVKVEESQLSEAHLALSAAGINSGMLDYDAYMSNSISTTSSDRETRYRLLRQDELELMLEAHAAVKKAQVILTIPRQNGTLGAQQEESSAWITLELEGPLSSANATYLARAVANALGNATTANITILDSDSNALFVGGDDYSSAGIANSMQELREQAEAMVANQVKKVLLGTNQYDQVTVTSHLDMDYSEYDKTVKEYYANDGRDEGMEVHRDEFESSSTSGVEGLPGTDSNDQDDLTGYVYPNMSNGESNQSEISVDRVPNESAERQITPAGGINYADSSMAISLITYREYHEESVDRQGLLEDISWEEFKDANSADVRTEVDEEFYQMAAMATGISAESITIIAYESPVFYDKQGLNISTTDIVSIVMIVLILALLLFAVLRSMRSRKPEPVEEELSVESMLQSTQDTVSDIDVEAKSETRKMIEKFVDENPEAAANLLRNWLSDEW